MSEILSKIKIIKGYNPLIIQPFDTIKKIILDNTNCNKQYSWTATWFGDVPYAYSGVIHNPQPMPEYMEKLTRRLTERVSMYRGYYNAVLMNYFPNGGGIGYHADDEPIFINEANEIQSVACISLGSNATISFKENATGNEENIIVENNDIYIMPAGSFQDTHKHKVKNDGERISITFRRIPTNIMKYYNKDIMEYYNEK